MQFFIGSSQFFRDSFAIADIADRTQYERSALRGDWTKTDFYREFCSVTPFSVEIQVRTHSSRLRCLHELIAMMVVLAAITLGDEHFDLLADQFVTVIPK